MTQSLFVDDLAERIERIGSENVDLQSRFDEAEYRGVHDISYNISDHPSVISFFFSFFIDFSLINLFSAK